MNDHSLRDIVNRSGEEQSAQILSGSWWHSIDLGDGRITPGVHSLDELQHNYRRFGLPEDLSGKGLLDLGCWDGFYAFESMRRGADVVAVDCWRPENFFIARSILNAPVEFHELNVYEVTPERVGKFDITLFLGVLYHLRHPLLALERVCEVTRELAIIETHVIDNFLPIDQPVMEFYEMDQLGGQYDNWWGPNTDCVVRLVRAAGFVRAEVIHREPARAVIKACRRWEPRIFEDSPSLTIKHAVNALTMGEVIPRRGRQAFIDLAVVGLPADSSRETIEVEVGGLGIRPIFVGTSGDPQRAGSLQVNIPVPPGLEPGPAMVRVAYQDRQSQELMIELVEGQEW
jgi:tRNA (mo5U34)-methyltransferase